MPFHVMSFHAKLCHFMQCYFMLCCNFMSCHAMLCHVMLCHAMSNHVAFRHDMLYHLMSYYFMLCWVISNVPSKLCACARVQVVRRVHTTKLMFPINNMFLHTFHTSFQIQMSSGKLLNKRNFIQTQILKKN